MREKKIICFASIVLMLITGCVHKQEAAGTIDKLPKREVPDAVQELYAGVNLQSKVYQINTELEQQEESSQNSGHTERELSSILVDIHKAYIYNQWFSEDLYGIPNNYYDDRIKMTADDLNEAAFYEDKEGNIYFIPTSMVNKVISVEGEEIQVYEYSGEESAGYYLYFYKVFDVEWRRVIYPEPDRYVSIFSEDVTDKVADFHFLGIDSAPFPEDVPEEAAKLYENEYTDAVVEIIHSYFHNSEMYGKYEIYFGDYHAFLFSKYPYGEKEYNIYLNVAIVGEDTSYWWVFRGKDTLNEDGQVIVESDGGTQHSFPAEYDKEYYNVYAPLIDRILNANRLAVPLTISPEDVVHELGSFKDEDDLNTIHYYLE